MQSVEIKFTLKNLKWMKPQLYPIVGSWAVGAKVMVPSPLGSVGVIAPWNFLWEVFLSCINFCSEMIMAKPSEFKNF